jgi:hypothetical protein
MNDKKRQVKKVYQKPVLTQVELRPEEAVLGACKTTSLSGPSSSPCSTLACTPLTS